MGKKKKIELGPEHFDVKNAKIKISMFVDGDVLQAYKAEAEKQHTKYQTLMNQKLREGISKSVDLQDQIREIVRQELGRAS